MTIASSKSPAFEASAAITSLSPLDVWTAIKTVLRRQLGEREWEMWIQHARLWRVMSGDTLCVLMPRNGRACYGIERHKRRVRALAARMCFGVLVSVEYDLDYHQMKREAIEAIDRGDDFPATHQHAQQLLAKWEEEHAWLIEPFLEPPCSLLWKEVNNGSV
jgi:hypothetical protein